MPTIGLNDEMFKKAGEVQANTDQKKPPTHLNDSAFFMDHQVKPSDLSVYSKKELSKDKHLCPLRDMETSVKFRLKLEYGCRWVHRCDRGADEGY
jgi:hypothetical protein